MKISTVLVGLCVFFSVSMQARNVETLVYSFPDGNSGLRMAWRVDSVSDWIPLGYDFVKNDFGPWGSHKKMFSPRLFVNAADGRWTAVWKSDVKGEVTALTSTDDFVHWLPQRYFASELDLPRDMYAADRVMADSANVEGKRVGGYVLKMSQELIDSLTAYVGRRAEIRAMYDERATDDEKRFAGLRSMSVNITPHPDMAKPVSDKLIGIFFEDINYSADGGLYAELVQNRDFEYMPSDRKGDDKWNPMHSWTVTGSGTFDIKTDEPVHINNPHYGTVSGELTLANSGYDGISVEKGAEYIFSMFVRTAVPLRFHVYLTDASGVVVGKGSVKVDGKGEWTPVETKLKANRTVKDGLLKIDFPKGTDACVDMISLFPKNTFRGRKNGLRKDLAETLADIKPRFVRFPGGCVAHGDGIDNIYDWKGSIGPLEARKPLRNIWGYHQTRGLGYHEYFLFCEDIGAEPLPVLAAGVPCQNSGSAAHHSTCMLNSLGQQCGIPMEEMPDYIRDILDLIEYANGDVTTEWGRKRAEAGHPKPFNLKYIGIGNEDMITEVFEPRFKMIYDAVREAYPDITVIGTVGPFYEGADYDAGWSLARRLEVPMVDEHYYVSPGWLIYNQDFYDRYPRGGTKVYLGEYASHIPGKKSNVETALSDALYLTAIERNADVVTMTSYAPLLAKKGHTQWNPDMIYFDNTSVSPTVEYHVQKLYGNNSGDEYIPATVSIDSDRVDVTSRIGVSVMKDTASDEYILKIVNMLPVKADVHVDMSSLGVTANKVNGYMLSGKPDDRKAEPIEVCLTLPDMTLPPYSFTVVRPAHE